MRGKLGTIHWKFIVTSLAVLLVTFIALFGLEILAGIAIPLLLTLVTATALMTKQKSVNRLAIPMFILWLVFLGTSFLSIEPHRSFYWLTLIGGSLLLVLLATELGRRADLSGKIVTCLLVGGAINEIFYYGLTAKWYLTWLQAYPGEWLPWLSYRLPASNLTAAYMAGCALLAAGLALKARMLWAKIGLWVYAGLAVGLIFLASSRGALVGLAAAGVVWAVLERSTWQKWLAPVLGFFRRRKIIGIAALVIVAVGVVGAGWLLVNAMAGHPTHGGAVLNARTLFWTVGWRMFTESPLWGNGLYTYSAFFMKAVSVPPWDIFLHPHNMHLDVLSSSGVIGGAAYIWLIWSVFRALARARKAAPADKQGLVLGATLMLVSYLGHGIFDAMYHMPAASLNLALALGAALAFDPPVERKAPRWALAVFGIGVCVLAWGTVLLRMPAIQAVNLAGDGQWQAGEVKMEKAVSLLPFSPLYQSQAGMMAAELARDGDAGALAQATAHYEIAVRLDPNVAAHHLNLGALYRSQGKTEQALAEFEAAAELAPAWDLAALQVGLAAEEIGESDMALRSYWMGLKLSPVLVDDPFWKTSLLRQQAVQLLRISQSEGTAADEVTDEAIVRQSYAGPILERAASALEIGEIARARSLTGAASLAYFQKGLEKMELGWLEAELAAADGNFKRASERGAEAVDGLEMQGLQGPGTAGWSLYDSGIYRMPDLKMELVPQVKVLRLFGEWPERMVQLAEWQRLAGDEAGSLETLRLLESWQE